MPDDFWKQHSVWWAPILVLLLGGVGWYIKTVYSRSDDPAWITGVLDEPPGKVEIHLDGSVRATTMYPSGFFRINDVKPGRHEMQWQYEGYRTKFSPVEIKGGVENRVSLNRLEPLGVEPAGRPREEEDVAVITDIHSWYAGTRYNGVVDMSDRYGFIWHCSGGTCKLTGPYGTGLNMAVCQELVRQVGPLEYYYNDAGMSWTRDGDNAELLAQCNAAANGTAEAGSRAMVTETETESESEDSRVQVLGQLVQPIVACLSRRDTDHPAFRGCVDWHSSVHAVWALLRYRDVTGSRDHDPLIATILEPNALQQEFDALKQDKTFEMPYGRAWFLRLAIDYEKSTGSTRLRDMADYVAASLFDYFSERDPDPGELNYGNPSWALINLYQYSQFRDRDEWRARVQALVKEFFVPHGQPCVTRNDGGRNGFMDVCGNHAWLVGLTGATGDYAAWLEGFMRDVDAIAPLESTDSLHEKGLNFSRAWSYWNIFRMTGDTRFFALYEEHMLTQLEQSSWWQGDDYTVTHWVAQFGVYALTPDFN